MQIFRLPGKGGFSTRPPGTTSSPIIWVEVYVASITYFPPTERRVNSPERGSRRGGPAVRGRGSCVTLGGKLEGEDVASERWKECRLRRCRCVWSDHIGKSPDVTVQGVAAEV